MTPNLSTANHSAIKDTDLVDEYTSSIPHHKPSLYSFRDRDRLYNPLLKQVISLLLRLIPTAPHSYELLLDALLDPLDFDQVCLYFYPQPKEVKEDLAKSEASTRYLLELFHQKGADVSSDDMMYFVAEFQLFYPLVEYLLDPDVEIYAIMDYSPSLLQDFMAKHPDLITVEKFEFLSKYTQDQILEPSHFDKHLQILTMVSVLDFSKQPWGSKLFQYDFSRMYELDDPEYGDQYYALAQVYTHWLGEAPWAWLKPFIADLFDYVIKNFPNRMAYHTENRYIMAFQEIFQDLLGCTGEAWEYAEEVIARPDFMLVDTNEPSSWNLFSNIWLANIPEKEKFFSTHFASLDIKSGLEFPCQYILALMTDEGFLHILIDNKWLVSENLRCWDVKDIVHALKKMTYWDFSVRYMLTELSFYVSSYLLKIDPIKMTSTIYMFSQVYYQKKAIRNLLRDHPSSLGSWRGRIAEFSKELEAAEKGTSGKRRRSFSDA
ncbi:hypothetical protein JCM33374_g5315 [Metschnikowia sp. JCM 33374]|nr:hypothetical protein JCM33374_g5315 [Metschnikowia sp. JCM 33374]